MVTAIKRRLVLAILLAAPFTFDLSGQAQSTGASEGVLSGIVADKAEDAPIPYAFVYVHGAYKKARADTSVPIDNAGRFRISLAPGPYDVFVAAAGFAPTCTIVSIRSGEETSFEPRLDPDFEHSEH
jgi:carboxypeptidase family protein